MEENKQNVGQRGQQEEYSDAPTSPTGTGDMEEISLREILDVLLKRKGFIALVVILCVVASFVFTRFFQTSSYASATLDLRFPQVEQGEYPSGEGFSPSDIISTSVLSRVVSDLGLNERGLNSSDLRNIASVEPIYGPGDEDELTEPLYQYRIIVEEHEDITPVMQRRIVSSIVEHYREAKMEEFIETPIFPRFSLEQDDLMAVDYPFIMASLLSYQELMNESAQEVADDSERFRSSSFGITFEDFSRSLDVLKETEYRDLSAFISESRLTRDRDMTLRRYRGMIQELEQEEKKLDSQSNYARELLGEAQGLRKAPLPAEFPFEYSVEVGEDNPGSLEPKELFQFLFEDNFFRHILDVFVETEVSAIGKKTRIAVLQKEMTRLEEEGPRGEEKEELKALADGRVEDYAAKLDESSEKLNQMMLEYYEGRPKEMIAYVVPPYQMIETGNLQLNLAVAGVLGLMLGVFAAFFHHYWKSTEKKDDED